MENVTLQTIINLQTQLNNVLARYIQLTGDERVRRILLQMLTEGHRHIQELGSKPAGPRHG